MAEWIHFHFLGEYYPTTEGVHFLELMNSATEDLGILCSTKQIVATIEAFMDEESPFWATWVVVKIRVPFWVP